MKLSLESTVAYSEACREPYTTTACGAECTRHSKLLTVHSHLQEMRVRVDATRDGTQGVSEHAVQTMATPLPGVRHPDSHLHSPSGPDQEKENHTTACGLLTEAGGDPMVIPCCIHHYKYS